MFEDMKWVCDIVEIIYNNDGNMKFVEVAPSYNTPKTHTRRKYRYRKYRW
jgi:hypothetical protein